jgi:hypothetical protein
MTAMPYYREFDAVADWLQVCAVEMRRSTLSADAARQSVALAVHRDPDLTCEQREALEELYAAFREVNKGRRTGDS